MPPVLRTILAILAGLVLGSIVNSLLVYLGPMVVPVPGGLDLSTPEGLKMAMPLMRPGNFLFPFLAHALGTLVGAFVASKISRSIGPIPALVVAVLFFIGGVVMVFQLPGTPIWFIVADLGLAYFPMGLLGHHLARRRVNLVM